MGNGATVDSGAVFVAPASNGPATGRASENGHKAAASNGHDPAHLNGNGATPDGEADGEVAVAAIRRLTGGGCWCSTRATSLSTSALSVARSS
jgi:hypothetical protein